MSNDNINEQSKSLLVMNLFDNIAPVYDLLNNIISFGLHKRWKKQAVDLLAINDGDKILDLCCGSGDMTQLILDKRLENITVTAADFSPNMLEIARKRFKNNSCVEVFQADAMNLPFNDEKFDRIIISFGLRNLENIPNGLKEINRVLKKEGRFVNIDFGKPDNLVFKIVFNLYFDFFVPAFGLLFKKFKEYAYLPSSIKEFPSPPYLVTLLENSGYKKAFYKNLFMGFVSIQVSSK